jgi:MFS family permease
MSLSWVSVTIASLAGVSPADAGIASGISNTARQVGGAIGLAVVSTIAATYGGADAAELVHGFRISFAVLFGLSLVSVVVAALFLVSRDEVAAPVAVEEDELPELVLEAA